MATLFPDSTRLGRATRKAQKPLVNATKPINETYKEEVTATGGTRTLSFAGQTTSALNHNATVAQIVSALEALSNIGVGDVDVKGYIGTSKVQTETLTATGGTRTLTVDGQTTSPLAYNANAATIQAALEDLSNVEVGDIVVSGTGPFVYTFDATKFADRYVPRIVVNTGSLTGGSSTIAVTGTASYYNQYTFQGAFDNLNVGSFTVDAGSLTGGTSTLVQDGSSTSQLIAREATREALAGVGQLRRGSQVQNDYESWVARKPKDIGDPDRIPGEK